MNPQLNYMIAQQRSAELQHAGVQARPASEVWARRRTSRPEPGHAPERAAWAEALRGMTAFEAGRVSGGAR